VLDGSSRSEDRNRKEDAMSAENKIKATAEKVTGKAKEAAGHIANNEKLVAEGKADQAKGHVRDAAENVKDVFKK